MRSASLLLCAVAVALAGALKAEDDYPIYVYPCFRAEAPLKVDGVIDEQAWQRAPLAGGFTYYNKRELVQVQTSIRVLFDDDYLYFGICCREPKAKRIVATPALRDDRTVFGQESVEIFVDPTHDHSNYFQLACNAAGGFYDSKRTDSTWDCKQLIAASIGDDSWSVELAVPWQDLGVTPKRGRVLGFNVCRNRQVDTEREWSNWSQTMANFHDPFRFGHLVIDPDERTIGSLTAEFRKGERSGPIQVFAQEGFQQKTYTQLVKSQLEDIDGALAKIVEMGKQSGPELAQALKKRVEGVNAELKRVRELLSGGRKLNADEWAECTLTLGRASKRVDEIVWEARLEALLESF